MDPVARHAGTDPVLETLMLPFATGDLAWPDPGRVLFLRARAGSALPASARGWTCEQSFRPWADALERLGCKPSSPAAEGMHYDCVLLLPPRQREESRALLAQALVRAAPGGVVVACVANAEGARSAEADLARLAGPVRSLSRSKCRVFWARAGTPAVDAGLVDEWSRLDAPRPIAEGRFLSRPGLFAWDRIDTASALLARHLPGDLHGRGADLGAGYGYLAAEVLARCPGVLSLDLYEAEDRALALARRNLGGARLPIGFFWHDVSQGLPASYDFIVSNPPFHQGRADEPALGRAFIAAAAAALAPGGRLWLVANRHLPYEAALAKGFARVRTVAGEQGFKVIEATRSER